MYSFCRKTYGITKQEFWKMTLREYVALIKLEGPQEEPLVFADDIY